MSTPRNARLIGFWQVPPEVWADEQAMNEFAQRVFDRMTAAGETTETKGEVEGIHEDP